MIFIAHRGLTDGPNTETENHPVTINGCLYSGLDVEVDVRLVKDIWYLGHDDATYETTIDFLRQPGLWLHCKNYEASFSLLSEDVNFFCHQSDDRTLTSKGFWWTQPQMPLGPSSIAVMPETYINRYDLSQAKYWQCAGICSDWIEKIRG